MTCEDCIGWLETAHTYKQEAAETSRLYWIVRKRNEKLESAIKQFLVEWDNSGSSGAWPVEALKHLREVMK